MLRVVISSFSLGGGRDAYVGDVVDLEERLAREREYQGFVRPLTAEEAAAHAAKSEPQATSERESDAPTQGVLGDVVDEGSETSSPQARPARARRGGSS